MSWIAPLPRYELQGDGSTLVIHGNSIVALEPRRHYRGKRARRQAFYDRQRSTYQPRRTIWSSNAWRKFA